MLHETHHKKPFKPHQKKKKSIELDGLTYLATMFFNKIIIINMIYNIIIILMKLQNHFSGLKI